MANCLEAGKGVTKVEGCLSEKGRKEECADVQGMSPGMVLVTSTPGRNSLFPAAYSHAQLEDSRWTPVKLPGT